MNWRVTFLNDRVKKETLAFPEGILADFLRIVEMIEDFGPALGEPYTKPFGEGLFEIRAHGKEGIGRSFFCTVRGREVIILHSFIKKSQKTPQKELKIARERLKEVKK